MKVASICSCATLVLVAGSTAVAEDKNPQVAEWNGKIQYPQRVATFNSQTGEIGQWVDVNPFAGRYDCPDAPPVYDAFEGDWDDTVVPDGSIYNPIDGDNPSGCAVGVASSRWYFGTGYCNTYYIHDFDVTVNPKGGGLPPNGGLINALSFGFFYGGDDGQAPAGHAIGNTEQLFIIAETYDDFDTTGAGPPASNFVSGFIFDYGVQTYVASGYTIFIAELCTDLDADGEVRDDTMTIPDEGRGAISVLAAQDLQDIDGDGTIDVVVISSCGQPMLWGPGVFDNGTTGPDPSRAGSNSSFGWDDDAPRDGMHDVGVEIYDYAFGICPDPLTAMTALLGNCCNFSFADWDQSGILNAADFLAYLNDYAAVLSGGSFTHGDPDLALPVGVINGADFLVYLNAFACCQ